MPIIRFIFVIALTFLSINYVHSETSQGLNKYQFNIPQQSVNSALIELALQRDLSIVYLADMTKSLTANAINGSYTMTEALNLILKDTKLRASIVNNRVIQIERVVLKPTPFNHKRYFTPLPKPKNIERPSVKPKTPEKQEVETIVVVGRLMSKYNLGTTVSSTKTQRDFLTTAQIVNALPEKLATDTNSRNYSDVISYVSSVTYLERSSGITDEMRLRGFAYPSLKINGVGSHAYVAPTDLAFVDRIEVAKGPSSVLFGRMEPGGIVNMMLKQPDNSANSISILASDDDYQRLEVDVQAELTNNTAVRSIGFVQRQGTSADLDLNDAEGLMFTTNTQFETGGELNFSYRYESEEILQQFGQPIEGFDNSVYFFREDNGEIEIVAPRQEDVRSGLDATRQSFYIGFNNWLIADWSVDAHLQFDQYQADSFVSYPVIEEFIVDVNGDSISSDELNSILQQNPELFELLIEGLQTISIDDDNIHYEQEEFNYDTHFFSGEFTAYQNHSFNHFELEQLYGFNYNNSKPQSLIWQTHDTRSNFVPGGQSEILAEFEPEETDVKDQNIGIFGQWVIDWNKLTLFAGVRFDYLDLSVLSEAIEAEESFEESTVRFGAVYKLTATNSIFFNYSESFSPQFRFVDIELDDENIVDESSIAIPTPANSVQYELGIKMSWLNDRIQSSCAFYEIEKEDIALLVEAQKATGLECDVAGSLGSSWHLVASYSNLDAEITDSEDPDLIGLKPRMTPEQTASLWLNKDIQLSEGLHSRWGLGVKYVGERFISLDNEVPLDEYKLIDLSASFEYANHMTFALFIRNVFDEQYTEGVFNALPYWTNPGSERTIETRFSYKF